MASSTSTSPTTTTTIPTKDYFVGITIGEGSFGRVVHARHKATGRDVAIKVFDKAGVRRRPNLLPSIWTERSLLQEFHASPLVVNLWGAFHDAECLYLVMECIQGGDLQLLINEGLQLSSSSSAGGKKTTALENIQFWRTQVAPHYALQLVQAVEYLHHHKCIHADLKPTNCLVTLRGRIKLADFGSAIRLNNSNSSENRTTNEQHHESAEQPHEQQQQQGGDGLFLSKTNSTTILGGTVDYASPEVLRGGRISELGRGADLWSLGCVFAALQLGESPFHATSDALAVDAIMDYVNGRSIPRSLMLDDDFNHNDDDDDDLRQLPDGWKDLIRGLLHPHPNKRLGVDNNSKQQSLGSQIPGYETIDLDVDPPFLPPEPQWVNDARNTKMRDGSLGWIAFVL